MEYCLNTEFWNEDGSLKEDVREVLLRVADDVINDMNNEFSEIGFTVEPDGFIFTGSLTGANWDADSDVDLHFLIDFGKYDDPELLAQFFRYFARAFNKKDFTLLDHDIEIYFQDTSEPHYSPGIYDIKNNEWIQPPDCVVITITDEHRQKALDFLERINEFKEVWDSGIIDDSEEFQEELREFFQGIKDYRRKGLNSEEGMYSFENIVFKLLRRNGALQTLVDLMREVKNAIYEVYRESQVYKESFESVFKWLNLEFDE